MEIFKKFRRLSGVIGVMVFGICATALAQGEATSPLRAVQHCECNCSDEIFVVAASDAEKCRSFDGTECRRPSGERAKLEKCSFLAAPEPTSARPTSLAAAAPPGAAAAGDAFCLANETWNECEERHLQETEQLAPQAAAATVNTAVAKEEANRQDLSLGSSTPSGASVKENFLQRFIAAIDLPGLSEEDGLLSFRYNPPGEIFAFEAAANKPELFAKLKEAIPEADRATKAAELEKTLGNFDAITYNLSINVKPNNTLLNRNREIKNYSIALMNQVVAEVKPEDGAEDVARRVYRLALRDLGISTAAPVKNSGTNRPMLEKLLKTVVEASIARDDAFVAAIEDNLVYKLSDLVANQPQFTLDVEGRSQDELIGPDTVEGSLALEIGLGANFNMLKEACAPGDLGCFKNFLEVHGQAVERKWRFKVEASYKETDAYDSPVAGVTLHLDKAESLIAKATFGGVLTFQEVEGKTVEQNSFAIEANYEDVTGDKARQNRFVAMATLTQRVSKDMSLELTALWANKPEYLGEVDEELSARAGVRYKFNRPTN